MNKIPNDIYKKIVRISNDVKNDLRKKGIMVPIKNSDGSISIGLFRIVKNDAGYTVLDRFDEPVVEQINLPQSAVLIANNLALGKFKDDAVIQKDRHYGYALFDEMLHKRAVEKSNKKSLEYFDLMLTKCLISKAKKERYKQDLVRSFEKLVKLV